MRQTTPSFCSRKMFFTAGVHGADAGDLLEQPDALLEEEIFIEQRADGAEIGDVAAELIVGGLPGNTSISLAVAAAIDVKLALAGDLAREAHAASAHDATVVVEGRCSCRRSFLGFLALSSSKRDWLRPNW